MIEPGPLPLQCTRGASFDYVFLWKITRPGGDPDKKSDRILFDMTGYTALMHIRAKKEDTLQLITLSTAASGNNPKIELGYTGGVLDPENGAVRLYIPDESTTPIVIDNAVYDLKFTKGPDSFFLLKGPFTFKDPVTR